jgi:hypothetical protein
MTKGESKVIIEDDDDDCDSCDDDCALSCDDLVAMVFESDDKLRMERSKLRDLEVKNVSLQNSFEELKTTHENLKISHLTLCGELFKRSMRSLRKLTTLSLLKRSKEK